MPSRRIFEGIVFVLRTGCQWKSLPRERFGSASSIHKYFRQWLKAGFFQALWRAGLAESDEMEGIAWKLQSVDGAMIKAPLAREAVGRNPTDREKKGSKRHLLVDGHGVPLSLIVTGANRHDVSQLTAPARCHCHCPSPRESNDSCMWIRGTTANRLASRFAPGAIPKGHTKEACTRAPREEPTLGR